MSCIKIYFLRALLKMIRKKKNKGGKIAFLLFFFTNRPWSKDASHLSVPVLGLDVVCKSLGLLVGGVAVAVAMVICTIQINTDIINFKVTAENLRAWGSSSGPT